VGLKLLLHELGQTALLLHSLSELGQRATVATHLLRQGVALSTIQEVLGHRSADTTQRYAATDVIVLREALEESER
jgi:site-specific recombinase XerD